MIYDLGKGLCLFMGMVMGERGMIPVRLEDAWVGRCTICRWWYVLHTREIRMCSNPMCPEGSGVDGQPVGLVSSETTAAVLSTYGLGGPGAVQELLIALGASTG